MLEKCPKAKNLFLVERLFSAGPLVLTERRNRLAENIFETLLMVKVNLNPKFKKKISGKLLNIRVKFVDIFV